MTGIAGNGAQWPDLPWGEWEATANTLHMWTQIVGKTRLALTPLQNHWWNVPLYVTARGLGTSAMAYGDDVLDIEFDFVTHELHLRLGSGKALSTPAESANSSGFFPRVSGKSCDTWGFGGDSSHAGRGAEADSVRSGHGA